jgi:hypothetical protein
MRFHTLAIMANWVLFGAKTAQGDGDSFDAQFEPPILLPDGSGQSKVAFTITRADTTRTTLYLIQISLLDKLLHSEQSVDLKGTDLPRAYYAYLTRLRRYLH